MKINFFNSSQDTSIPAPISASREVPDWYKKLPRYSGKEKQTYSEARTDGTVKTCMPFLDAMTAGYLILSSADIYIRKTPEGHYFTWASNNLVSFHPYSQIEGFPKYQEKYGQSSVPKFNNPWVIKTKKNYSCLFITPSFQNLPFQIISGVVDTDKYFNPINFPFFLDPEFEGLIPKGTPIAQVIPFERQSWKMEVSMDPSLQQRKEMAKTLGIINGEFFDKYKKHFWVNKEYK